MSPLLLSSREAIWPDVEQNWKPAWKPNGGVNDHCPVRLFTIKLLAELFQRTKCSFVTILLSGFCSVISDSSSLGELLALAAWHTSLWSSYIIILPLVYLPYSRALFPSFQLSWSCPLDILAVTLLLKFMQRHHVYYFLDWSRMGLLGARGG